MNRPGTRATWIIAAGILALILPAPGLSRAVSEGTPAPEVPTVPPAVPVKEPETAPTTEPEGPALVILHVEVLDEDSKMPIQGAEVFVKSEEKDVTFEEIRETNSKGLASFPEVPRGFVKIQVIARGCKTFGDRYSLEEEENEVTIALKKRPANSVHPDLQRAARDAQGIRRKTYVDDVLQVLVDAKQGLECGGCPASGFRPDLAGVRTTPRSSGKESWAPRAATRDATRGADPTSRLQS